MKNKAELKEQINSLSNQQLKDIVLKLASKDENYNYLVVNYFDKQNGENDLFEKTKREIDFLFTKRYKGFSEQLQIANLLSACNKQLNEFAKVCKNKKLEADLIMYILEIPFEYPPKMFGTCFTAFDFKVTMLIKRIITLVTKRLHEDFKLDYLDKINDYLTILHTRSNHNDFVYNLPKILE
jgi:hypothetical protein